MIYISLSLDLSEHEARETMIICDWRVTRFRLQSPRVHYNQNSSHNIRSCWILASWIVTTCGSDFNKCLFATAKCLLGQIIEQIYVSLLSQLELQYSEDRHIWWKRFMKCFDPLIIEPAQATRGGPLARMSTFFLCLAF